MSDLPFGFSNRDDDERKRGDDPSGAGPNDPFGIGGSGAGGFDPAQLGQMLTSLGQMLSGMGQQPGGAQAGPVNYDVAKRLARQQIGATVAPVTAGAASAVADAAHLAELWLDGATALPAGATKTVAWTANDWIEQTLPTWQRLCDPVAQQISGMWTSSLPEEAMQFAAPMVGMLAQMGGLAFGSQLGQALGQLAKEVLTSTDIGLPLAPPAPPPCCPPPSRSSARAWNSRKARSWCSSPRAKPPTSGCSGTCRGCASRCSARSRITPGVSGWTSPHWSRPRRASTRCR